MNMKGAESQISPNGLGPNPKFGTESRYTPLTQSRVTRVNPHLGQCVSFFVYSSASWNVEFQFEPLHRPSSAPNFLPKP